MTAQHHSPAEHYAAAEEYLEQAKAADPFQDAADVLVGLAMTHGLLAIAGQLTPQPVRFIPPTVQADPEVMDTEEMLSRAKAAGAAWAGGR